MRRMTERFVAFLDVLGFSDMVQAVDHDLKRPGFDAVSF